VKDKSVKGAIAAFEEEGCVVDIIEDVNEDDSPGENCTPS